MPADLFPNEVIANVAKQIDSPKMLDVLRRIVQERTIYNTRALDTETFGCLERLAGVGLVDPGYDGQHTAPHMWISNQNGSGVLNCLAESEDDEPPAVVGNWLP